MPNLGSGLSLGTISQLPGFDFDASNYIIANNIPNSAPYYTTNNNYLEFTGSGGYLSVPSNSELQLSSLKAMSFSFWFKTPSSITDNQYFFGKELEYALRIENSSQMLFLCANDGSGSWGYQAPYNLGTTLQTNTWYHVVFFTEKLTSSTGRVKLYLNSTNLGTTNGTATQPTWGNSNNNAFIIGQKDIGITSQNWRGGIKHFGIWTRELTQTEVTWLYNSGTPRTNNDFGTGNGANLNDSNLKYYWRFDENFSDITWYPNMAFSYGLGNITSQTGSVSTNTSESVILYTNPQTNINNFIKKLKELNIWQNIWVALLRKNQNRTSSIAPSVFGGLPITSSYTANSGGVHLDPDGMVFRGLSGNGGYLNLGSVSNGNKTIGIVFNNFPKMGVGGTGSLGDTNAEFGMMFNSSESGLGSAFAFYMYRDSLNFEANISGTNASRYTETFTANQTKTSGNLMYQISHNGSQFMVKKNNNSNTNVSVSGSWDGAGTITKAGARFNNFPYGHHRGRIQLIYVANADISSSFSQIYSEYKNGLGLGLELP